MQYAIHKMKEGGFEIVFRRLTKVQAAELLLAYAKLQETEAAKETA